MNKIVAMLLSFLVFASFVCAETALAQSAKVLKGHWSDGNSSGSLQISFQNGWNAGLFELWCHRGGTRVNFVLKQSSDARVYVVVNDSSPNSCGVESFTIQPDGSGWRGDISASYQTTFTAK